MPYADLTPKELERFWAKVDKSADEFPDVEGCWLWTGGKHARGYGLFSVYRDGKYSTFRVHRVVYEMVHGEIPDGAYVCHACDTPSCCRPVHLFAGTHQDNVNDKVAKGRQVQGAGFSSAKLNDDAVREIRKARASGLPVYPFAKKFGVTPHLITLVVQGKIWKHVD